MRITPDVQIIEALINSGRVDYVLLISEAIDNALDAGATEINVSISRDKISIKDNGIGIAPGDTFNAALTLGLSVGALDRVGRFGFGLKLTAMRAGNELHFLTVHNKMAGRAKISWKDLLEKRDWELDDPHFMPLDAPSGTIVTIAELRPSPTWTMEKLRFDIAMRFHPALAAGAKITVNDTPIEPLPEPAMDHSIDLVLDFSRGRKVHLRAGILTEQSKLRQVHVSFKHRVIKSGCGLGCRDYSGTSQLFARVQLTNDGTGTGWQLGLLKDELPNENDVTDLEDALFPVLQPLLELCQSASMTAKLDAFQRGVNEMLPSNIAARPKHKKAIKTKSNKKPSRSGGMVDPLGIQDIGKGPAKAKTSVANSWRLQIEFDALGADTIGNFSEGVGRTPNRVIWSTDNPHIRELMTQRDQKAGRIAIVLNSLQWYFGEVEKYQRLLPVNGTYGERLASMLNNQDEVVWSEDIA